MTIEDVFEYFQSSFFELLKRSIHLCFDFFDFGSITNFKVVKNILVELTPTIIGCSFLSTINDDQIVSW